MLKKNFRTVILAVLLIAMLLSLTACKDKDEQPAAEQTTGTSGSAETGSHTHTYAQQYSYDGTNHWRQATCEHGDEKADLAAHQFDGSKCQVCGCQQISLLVKTNADNQKYVRTKSISEMLKLGFAYAGDTTNVQWVSAKESHIEGFSISDSAITVQVAASANNTKYTAEITIPLDDTAVNVDAFLAQTPGDKAMLRGVVAGFSTIGSNNEVLLADKQTGTLISVTQMGTGKLLYGGYCLDGVTVGDEIIIPVSLVQDKTANTSANSAKRYAEYQGGTAYETAVVSGNNQIQYAGDKVIIDSQADLAAFLSAGNRENNHYKLVTLKGNMNFVMDSTYENYNFWFSEKSAKVRDDILIDGIVPCFSDPALFYTLGTNFSDLVLGASHMAAIDYTKPLSANVEITAVFLGGNTSFGQFLILDQAWVTK